MFVLGYQNLGDLKRIVNGFRQAVIFARFECFQRIDSAKRAIFSYVHNHEVVGSGHDLVYADFTNQCWLWHTWSIA